VFGHISFDLTECLDTFPLISPSVWTHFLWSHRVFGHISFDLTKCLDTFPLISPSDIVSINRLTLILKTISQCDVKHIMMLQIKTIMWVLEVSTYIIISIIARPIILTVILVIMSVSTFKTAVFFMQWIPKRLIDMYVLW
jgi:hypothetical protein